MDNVSLVLLTHNSTNYLPGLFQSLSVQSIIPNDLICIDSESKDNSVLLCKENNFNVYNIKKDDFDHGGTRQLALEYCKHNIVIFITHDIIFHHKDSIRELIASISNDKIAAGYGRQLPRKEADFFSKRLRSFNYPSSSHTRFLSDRDKYGFKTAFLSDSFSVYKKDIINTVGGFKKDIIFGEDAEIASRFLLHGYGISYSANAEVLHSHNYTIIQDFKRYFDTGVFHKMFNSIIQNFGKPTGEGLKYVIEEIKDIIKVKEYHLLSVSFIRNFFKWLGYNLGFRYMALPFSIRACLSMNKNYWIKQRRSKQS